MEIFGIGPFELLLILVVALIVFGPGQLPEIARTLGKATRQVRESLDAFNKQTNVDLPESVREEAAKMLNPVTDEIKGVSTALSSLGASTTTTAAAATPPAALTPGEVVAPSPDADQSPAPALAESQTPSAANESSHA
jgi:sec-independent protein translocase protein TatA